MHDEPTHATPTDLTVRHLRKPVGIDRNPVFRWVRPALAGPERAARVRLRRRGSVVWDSGEIPSRSSSALAYSGAPLPAVTEHEWTVESIGSPTLIGSSTFVTGVLDAALWKNSAWISGDAEHTAAPWLRREFTIDSPPREAFVVVAAGGYARAALNAAPIEPRLLSPGVTDYDKRVQYTVSDVSTLLSPGANCITAELGRGYYAVSRRNIWRWHEARWRSTLPAVRALLVMRWDDGHETVLGSDRDWSTRPGDTTFDDLYAGEDFDVRRSNSAWLTAGFDDSDWSAAQIVAGPTGALEAQEYDAVSVIEELFPSSASHLADDRWVIGFPRVIAGWPRLRGTPAADEEVTLRAGETLTGDGAPYAEDDRGYYEGRLQTHRITGSGRPLDWTPRFTYQGFQYIEVTARELPLITAQVAHNRVGDRSSFRCSDDLLTRVHDLTKKTIVSNLQGIPTDTPMYEKNGWTGDVMLGAEMMLRGFDTVPLLAKWSRDVVDTIDGTGRPSLIAPDGGWDGERRPCPPWHAALVMVPWHIFEHTGDDSLLHEHAAEMAAYVRTEISDLRDGIATTILGDWVGPDTDAGGGNPHEDLRVAATAFLYRTVRTMARIAALTGGDRSVWDRAAVDIRSAFQREFLDRRTSTVRGAGDDGYRQSHAVLALAFDLCPIEVRPSIAAGLAADVIRRGHHLDTGALATKWILPVLSRFGYDDIAYSVATQTTFPSWGSWIAQGATSLWEHWKSDSRSRGHYFLGTIDDWLFSDLLGIRNCGDAWATIRVSPRLLSRVEWASGHVDTVRGPVALSWRRRTPGSAEATLDVPNGSRAFIDGASGGLGPGRHTVTITGIPESPSEHGEHGRHA